MTAAVAGIVLLSDRDEPPTTLAGSTSTTATTEVTTTTLAPTTTAPTTTTPTSSTTTSTLAGTAYDQAALDYFRAIAGSSEFGGSGGGLHRWTGDLRIGVFGDPTPADRTALAAVVDDLNEIIDTVEISTVGSDPNIEIHFAPVDDFPSIEPNYVEGNMGYVYIWWGDDGSIYRGRVLISTTGLTPEERAHLIREELTQSLGLLNDSWDYPESIFFQGWTDITEYAPIDRTVIEMLYRPEVSAGMDIGDAVAVLAGLGAG